MDENEGFVIISPAINGPLMVSGPGRSGTTGMMRALCSGGMTPLIGGLGNRNAEGEMTHLVASGHWSTIKALVDGKDKSFVVKVPSAISRAASLPKFCDAWTGNWVVMIRDPLALAVRERIALQSVGIQRNDEFNIMTRSLEASQNLIASYEVASHTGVMLVSYEKLLIRPRSIAIGIAEWLGIEIDHDAFCSEIIPSDPRYIKEPEPNAY